MAKLKVTFIVDRADKNKNVEWIVDDIDGTVTQEQAQKSLQRLKRIEYLLKPSGEPLYRDVKEIDAEILQESAVLTVTSI